MTDGHPDLTWADAWLLAALMQRRRGRSATLHDLAHDVDYLERAEPSFDQVSYGLQRLAVRGLVAREADRIGATATAWDLVEATPRDEAETAIDRVARAIGAPADWSTDLGDVSAGRFPGVTEQGWEAGVDAHAAEALRVLAAFERLIAMAGAPGRLVDRIRGRSPRG